jgi:thiol-disulfide isomerase/thioredoxin
MKKILIAVVLAILNVASLRGQALGIHFENRLDWQQLLAKAKAEHRYVFIDCFATWCGPCKRMDATVFVNDTVGNLINPSFIAIRLQMDRTAHDSDSVQNWYGLGDSIASVFRVSIYPTYLFLSPDCVMVHKAIGEMNVQGFAELVKSSRDPQQQYYTLLARYNQGKMPNSSLPLLAQKAKDLFDDSLAEVLAGDYINHHIALLSDEEIWTKDNLDFINKYKQVIHSKDTIFKKYIKEKLLIDSAKGKKNYSNGLINSVMNDEEIRPKVDVGIHNHIEPNWEKMKRIIQDKYGSVDEYAILKERVRYYKETKDSARYATYFVRQMNLIRLDTFSKGADVPINNSAFEVFTYSNNKKELEDALRWINHGISLNDNPNPSYMDTKANILYKLHRNDEALDLEQRAAALAPDNKEIQQAYIKMRKNLPTW